jgi:hypothetical protein
MMNESNINFADVEEDIFDYEVLDQALEAAAGTLGGQAANFTLSFCTGLETCPT